MRRKNTRRFDPRYFMDEKTDVLEEARGYGQINYPPGYPPGEEEEEEEGYYSGPGPHSDIGVHFSTRQKAKSKGNNKVR